MGSTDTRTGKGDNCMTKMLPTGGMFFFRGSFFKVYTHFGEVFLSEFH